jgi:hypothetical protein
MPRLEPVREFVVGNWPWPVCDDCIADKLELPAGQRLEHQIKALAQLPRFVRERAGCRICSQIKEVIRFAWPFIATLPPT